MDKLAIAWKQKKVYTTDYSTFFLSIIRVFQLWAEMAKVEHASACFCVFD
jgi:hypothetical protein